MESFFKTLKVERIHRVDTGDHGRSRARYHQRIEGFYNQSRIHSSIGYKTPIDVESSVLTT